MPEKTVHPLHGEKLIPIAEAAEDFGGIAIPLRTVRHYIYNGFQGIKLETININGRYTSKEAISRQALSFPATLDRMESV